MQVPAVAAALRAATGLCQRQAREAAPAVVQKLWLRVLRVFVLQLRQLRAASLPSLPNQHTAPGKRFCQAYGNILPRAQAYANCLSAL